MKITFNIEGRCVVEDADKSATPQEIAAAIEDAIETWLGAKANVLVTDLEVIDEKSH